MFTGEILKLLKKISHQLENILKSQDEIKGEIEGLRQELTSYQEATLKGLDQTLPTRINSLLN